MLRHLQFYSILFLFLWMGACSNSSVTTSSGEGSSTTPWLINTNEILDGGPGKDGIPSIDTPVFKLASEIDSYSDNRLVLAIKVGATIHVYPHQIIDWHEIVNDTIEEEHIALTYCPLTGTGMAWNRAFDGEVTTFGVSGLLYRNNLIPYDRSTDSNWSQMQLRGVQGERSAERIQTYPTIEMYWGSLKSWYPNAKVLTTQIGATRDYDDFAYGEGYLTNNDFFIFPRTNDDQRLPAKQRVHALFARSGSTNGLTENSTPLIIPLETQLSGISTTQTTISGQSAVVVQDPTSGYINSFNGSIGGVQLTFQSYTEELPGILKDNEGNVWDYFGEAISGPRKGQRLDTFTSYNGYWFALADFFPEAYLAN
jgi:hypothetical protein